MTWRNFWKFHDRTWTHCLRCGLCEHRVQDTGLPYRVGHAITSDGTPLSACEEAPDIAVHVMYPCPDSLQFEASNIPAGADSRGAPKSPTHRLLMWSLEVFRDAGMMPPGLTTRHIACSYALGCRPINFKNPRTIMKAKREFMKMCENRWVAETVGIDADLVLVCGTHALAAVRPDLAKDYHRLIGEVVPFELQHPGGPLRYEAFVTYSPEDVVTIARRDHYVLDEWSPGPVPAYSQEPVKAWLWNLLWALWLAHAVRHQIRDIPGHKDFEELTDALNRSFSNRTTIQELAANAEQIQRREQALGSRLAARYEEEDE